MSSQLATDPVSVRQVLAVVAATTLAAAVGAGVPLVPALSASLGCIVVAVLVCTGTGR